MTAITIEQQFQELLAAVASARTALADGAAVDVAGLDAAVGEVCAAAQNSDRADRPGIVAAVTALQAALDALSADLARQHSALHRKRATEAYGGEPGP